jgi:protein tyrosine/serine phosphatase
MKRIICGLLLLVLVLSAFVGCFDSKPDSKEPQLDFVAANIAGINKHGNVFFDIKGAQLFDKGFEYGDILEISIADKIFEAPLCSSYTDVDNGKTVIRATTAESDVVLAINMGDLATSSGLATKVITDDELGFRWDYLIAEPIKVEIKLKEAGAYRDQWLIHQLVRTNERADYEHLSDEAFANFRVIDTTGMGKNVLYRSSSPINPNLNRHTYADKAARNAGIKTVINLADFSNTYEGTENFYYNTCEVIYLSLGIDFVSEEAAASIANGMRFIINGEAPYLLHCNEGKDRGGFASALLECLMGATIDEVIEDYMETYYNYYGVQKNDEKYMAIVNNNIITMLKTCFDIENVYEANLQAEAEEYLLVVIGLSADEVIALKAKLSQ